jgi:ComF family protein
MPPAAWLETLAKLLIPARCVLCGTIGPENVCAPCGVRLERVGPCCARCGRQRSTEWASPDCGECHAKPLGVAQARSMLLYNAAGRELLAAFKFNRREAAGAWLARQFADFARPGLAALYTLGGVAPALVVPVPIHAQRRRERGFNQAEALAAAVGAQLGLPCRPGLLERTRPTPTQIGLTAAQRLANVRGAFAVPAAAQPQLAGRCVLLVDDLMTTGATLRACALALRRGGASSVLGLTAFSTTYSAEVHPLPARL